MRFEIYLWKWELGMDLFWIEQGGMSLWKRTILFRVLIALSPIFNLGFSLRPEGPSLNLIVWPFQLECNNHYLDLSLRRRTIYKLRKKSRRKSI